jgi:hypothetical protein
MNRTASQREDLFRRARSGDREALGALLEEHRSYLHVLTDRQLDQQLEARLDFVQVRTAWLSDPILESGSKATRMYSRRKSCANGCKPDTPR